MTEYLFQLPDHQRGTLQTRIQEMLVNSILQGHLEPDQPLPSSRKLARQLCVARNTVVYAYQHLVDEGFLVARERSGFYVNREILKGRVRAERPVQTDTPVVDWSRKLIATPDSMKRNTKPVNWRDYSYPFICGQYDQKTFPIADWRECSREAASVTAIHDWARDLEDQDNPELIDQIHKKLLPRRGVWAEPGEILVTIGAQQGIFIAAQLLLDGNRVMGFESPGYVDAENSFRVFTSKLKPLNVDGRGLVPDQDFADCDLVYTTPSHQYPTTITMPRERRQALLDAADRHDLLIIEDDYESEFNYVGEPTPALKSMDQQGRVIYIGSLSKTLAPGIRLGYMVAPAPLIRQARALRRLMVRHPASNNQYILARFLKRGYHDALISRLSHNLHQRWTIMGDLLEQYLPGGSRRPTFGGSAIWVEGPASLDSRELLARADQQGILFEPGDVFFHGQERPRHFFRLGFSSIPAEQIEPGIRKLMELMKT